jgi:hypothetical protein
MERAWTGAGGARTPDRSTSLLVVFVALLVVAAGTLWVTAGHGTVADKDRGPSQLAVSAFGEQTGILVTRVAVTGGGGLIDFRYQVIDQEKAALIHESAPRLIDEQTGAVIDTLFMGHAHGGTLRAGSTYPVLFVNEAGLIEPGRLVSVAVGGARLEHVQVL